MGITQLKVSSKEITPILIDGTQRPDAGARGFTSHFNFRPAHAADLSSTSTTAVGFSGEERHAPATSFREASRFLSELRISIAGDENQATSRIDVFFESCVFLGRRMWSG